MKMTDKSFAIKIEGSVFTGNEIYEMEVEGTSFKLFCGYESGTKFEISGNLKNLEFIENVPTAREWEGYEMCRDRGFYGPPFGSHKNDTDTVTPLEKIRQAFRETNECNNEIIYPSHPIHKELTEILKNSKKSYVSHGCMPCFKDENMEPTAAEEVFRKAFNEAMEEMSASIKSAGESIIDGLKAMTKANESIKVDLSIDGEKFSKLIRDYGKPIAPKDNDYEWVWVYDPVNGNHLAWAKKHNTGGD